MMSMPGRESPKLAVHFIDQHVTASIPLPADHASMSVHDFVAWAVDHIENARALDIFKAIAGGNVQWFRYLRSSQPGGSQHEMDVNRKLLDSIIQKKSMPRGKQAWSVTFSAPYSFPCMRCGACCMPPSAERGFRQYLGETPPADGVYYVAIGGMPYKVKVPDGIDVLDLGTPARCAHLSFDVAEGLYGCRIHDGIRGYACKKYSCSSMLGDLHRWEGTFTKASKYPKCNACIDHACSACFWLPTRVEWFIAYTRKNNDKAVIFAEATSLLKYLREYKERVKTQAKEPARSCIDDTWLDGYMVALDDIATAAAKANPSEPRSPLQRMPARGSTVAPRAN